MLLSWSALNLGRSQLAAVTTAGCRRMFADIAPANPEQYVPGAQIKDGPGERGQKPADGIVTNSMKEYSDKGQDLNPLPTTKDHQYGAAKEATSTAGIKTKVIVEPAGSQPSHNPQPHPLENSGP